MAVSVVPLGGAVLDGARPTIVGRWAHMDGLSFGEWVRRYRKARGYSMDVLAELAKTNKSTISDMETDPEYKPGHDLALRIIDALQAPAEPFIRSLGYTLEIKAQNQQAAAEDAIAASDLSEEKKQAALEVIRALFR